MKETVRIFEEWCDLRYFHFLQDVCSVSMIYCEMIKRKIEISIQEEGNCLTPQVLDVQLVLV